MSQRRTDGVMRKLKRMQIRGEVPGGKVPPLVARHEHLAVAAVMLSEALDDLMGAEPSPGRAVSFLVDALRNGGEDFDGWPTLFDEFEQAAYAFEEADEAILARLTLSFEQVLDELRDLVPEAPQANEERRPQG